MPTLEFYNERAADCRREADASTLANVRERCLTAAIAWDHMADRLRRSASFREQHAAAKSGEADRAGDE